MKYRIILRGDNYYQIQKKKGFFYSWETVNSKPKDYPNGHLCEESYNEWIKCSQYKECWTDVFSNLEWAQAKLKRLVEARNQTELKKKFEVIEEVII